LKHYLGHFLALSWHFTVYVVIAPSSTYIPLFCLVYKKKNGYNGSNGLEGYGARGGSNNDKHV